jgi:RimJ/RimL family protein N-acetyltransferase
MAVTVTIRLAQDSDRAAMEAIAARTWGGDDYLPQVLTEWLADPNGYYYVASREDQVVGMSRLVRLDTDEWWMEGIRVDPDLYGQGIGRELHYHCVKQAQELGSGVVRFATSSANRAIHKLASETAFERIGDFVLYRTDGHPLDRTADEFRTLTPDDIPAIRTWLDSSSYHAQAARSLEQSWRWYFITDDRLQARIEQSLIYGWYDKGILAGLVIFNLFPQPEPGRVPILNIAYLDASVGKLATLALAVRGLATQLGYRKMGMRFLARPERLVAMEQAGWRRLGQDAISLFRHDL